MEVGLKKNDRVQLSKWIGARRRYTLLYRATRDGCSSTMFHNRCNNRGPTLTVLYNTEGYVYGGYTSVSWKSNGSYVTDDKAFLFRLYQNGRWKPVQMQINNSSKAIYGENSYGPTFGGGHDLRTFTNTVDFNGTNFPLNGSVSFGHSYIVGSETYDTVANGHLQVKELEVYLVEDAPPYSPLDDSWRETKEWDVQFQNEMKERIERYKTLKELKVSQARILMVGQVGAGKSSFFNTINSIFRGYITSQACSGYAEHSLTTVYRMHQIRNGIAGIPMNFRLHDTMGLEADLGIDTQELCYILDGHIPDRHQFNPSVTISPKISGFVEDPKLSDKIHCVALVVDGSTVDVMSEKVIERLRILQNHINQREIPQVVLLTKIDKICEITEDDLSQVFYSPTVKETVDRVSQLMGLPRSHVLPVKNYESEMYLDTNINILAMLALRQMLNFADDYMYNYLDQPVEKTPKQLNKIMILILIIAAAVAVQFYFLKSQ